MAAAAGGSGSAAARAAGLGLAAILKGGTAAAVRQTLDGLYKHTPPGVIKFHVSVRHGVHRWGCLYRGTLLVTRGYSPGRPGAVHRTAQRQHHYRNPRPTKQAPCKLVLMYRLVTQLAHMCPCQVEEARHQASGGGGQAAGHECVQRQWLRTCMCTGPGMYALWERMPFGDQQRPDTFAMPPGAFVHNTRTHSLPHLHAAMPSAPCLHAAVLPVP